MYMRNMSPDHRLRIVTLVAVISCFVFIISTLWRAMVIERRAADLETFLERVRQNQILLLRTADRADRHFDHEEAMWPKRFQTKDAEKQDITP